MRVNKDGTISIYTALRGVGGTSWRCTIYFETIKARNDYVRAHVYADKGPVVRVTRERFNELKMMGGVKA